MRLKYLITFGMGTKYERLYVELISQDKDLAYSEACARYGFMNVCGVYVDNAANREVLRVKGFKQMQGAV